MTSTTLTCTGAKSRPGAWYEALNLYDMVPPNSDIMWAPPELRNALLAANLHQVSVENPCDALLKEIAVLQQFSGHLADGDFATRYRVATRIDEVRAALHTLTVD